jgi:hypothetical protein
MKLEQIEALWDVDCKIDKTALDDEALKISELHNKYYKLYIREVLHLKTMNHTHDQLIRDKKDYYSGKTPKEDLDEKGWKQFPNLLLKEDIPVYVSADQDIINSLVKISVQREKCAFLESIIKTINDRGFKIKSAIDFIKFTQGCG